MGTVGVGVFSFERGLRGSKGSPFSPSPSGVSRLGPDGVPVSPRRSPVRSPSTGVGHLVGDQ